MERPPRSSKDNAKNLTAEWEARLSAEGMPSELETEDGTEEHSSAFGRALDELREHYLTIGTDEHFAHRQALDSVRARAVTLGASAEELELLGEDLARGIEDEMSAAQVTAQTAYQELERNSATFVHISPEKQKMLLVRDLAKKLPQYPKDVLYIIADKAIAARMRARE